MLFCFFFFNDTATTEIYTLSLHDALPIYHWCQPRSAGLSGPRLTFAWCRHSQRRTGLSSESHPYAAATRARISLMTGRSEEHTSELQSQSNLVCRLLLEKKKSRIVCSSPR